METTRIYLGLKLPETNCACSPSNTMQLQVSWVEKGKERSLLRNERNTSPQNQPFVVRTVLASGPFSRREVALNPNLKGKKMHLIWGDLSLKHTRSIFLTFLSFSRSHNSLFTWTCCLFLSLSVPSSVRTGDYRGRRRAVDLMLFMWFSEAFFRSIYFFSFYLDSAVILLQNQGHVGVYWGIYISATPNTFTLIVFFNFTEVTTFDHCDHICLLRPQGTTWRLFQQSDAKGNASHNFEPRAKWCEIIHSFW